MNRFAGCLLAAALAAFALSPHRAAAQSDGRHDFDFELGTWKIHVQRLVHPLSGSHAWVSPSGYVHIVRKLWDGATLAELENQYPKPHFLGLLLHLYNARSQQWSVYWGDGGDGTVSPPVVGHFESGRGVFNGKDVLDGKPILVRVVYSDITKTSFRSVQSFSADGGKTWEPNLIQTFTREK